MAGKGAEEEQPNEKRTDDPGCQALILAFPTITKPLFSAPNGQNRIARPMNLL
jgi:hypothetical protein